MLAKRITMKKYILLLIVSFIAIQLFAQEETEKIKDKPVSSAWENGLLIDNQTSYIPDARTLEFVIQHKFGTMDNGKSDLWGIYAPGSNIRLGLNYVAAKNFQIGVGTTKKNMYTDFNAKWTILEQTRENAVPFALTLFGSTAIDGRNEELISSTGKVTDSQTPGNGVESFGFGDRLSYFSQVIIGRKFTDWLSIQAAASYTHYNTVAFGYDHDKIGIHFNGRIKVSSQGSIIFNYDLPLKIESYSEQSPMVNYPKENVAIGYEISTSTHAFQIYVGTADGIIPQDNMMYNYNDWTDHGLAIGFVITRLWMF